MAKRLSQIEKAIENIEQQIAALSLARHHLLAQLQELQAPKDTPKTASTAAPKKRTPQTATES